MKLHILIETLHINDSNLVFCKVFVNNSATNTITKQSKFNILTIVVSVEAVTVYAISVTNYII